MTFGSPAWLGLLALPALLVLVHLLRRSGRDHPVSSDLLWREFTERRTSRKRFSLPPLDPALLLALAILSLLAVSAAGPWWASRESTRALAVVIDCSPSMGARDEAGASRLEAASRAASRLLDSAPSSRARFLMLAGDRTRTLETGPGRTNVFADSLGSLGTARSIAPLDTVVAAASAIVAERGGGRVVVLSDFVDRREPIVAANGDVAVELVAVGREAPNVAVTSLVASRGESLSAPRLASATVANGGRSATPVELTARVDGTIARRTTIDLPAQGTAIWRFPVDRGERLEVLATPGGALAADDSRTVVLPASFSLEQAGRPLPIEIAAAVAALGPADDPVSRVELYHGDFPDRPSERWIYFAREPRRDAGTASMTTALDIRRSADSWVRRLHPILVDGGTRPVETPPEGARSLATLGGLTAIALVEREDSRGIWFGIPVQSTDLVDRGLVALLLAGMLEGLDPPADEPLRTAGGPGILPAPPEGASRIEALSDLRSARVLDLRGWLLGLSAALLLAATAHLAPISPRRVALPAVALLLIGTAWLVPRWRAAEPGTLALVVDSSSSVAIDSRAAAVAWIDRGLRELPDDARVALMSFDDRLQLLALESAGQARGQLDSVPPPRPEATRTGITEAIEAAAALVGSTGGGSILLATDGHDASGATERAARRAALNGVPVHVLPLTSPQEEVALDALNVPETISAGEVFEAQALVRSTVDQTVRVRLEQDGAVVASGSAELRAGTRHALPFLLEAGTIPGTLVARVIANRDADPGNNSARARIDLAGSRRYAAVGYAGPLEVTADRFDRVPHPDVLERYAALLLRLDGRSVSPVEQQWLARYVESGRGLVVTCDDPETAVSLRGGSLERILPVRLAPPLNEAREAAVVILIDRSGSMDRSSSDGSALRTAGESVAALTGLLESGDRYGLIAFDVEPHVLRPLASAGDPAGIAGRLPGLTATGGTNWGPALRLAAEWLADDEADFRHVVLITDGRLAPDASDEPRPAWPEGVTLSTVSVGPHADREPLIRLARDHGGRHDHLERLDDLPSALRREAARARPPEVRYGPLFATPESGYESLLGATRIAPGRRALVVDPVATAELAVKTDAGDVLLALARRGWGASAFLAADPTSLGEPATILTAALERTAGNASTEDAAASVRVDGAQATLEVLIDDAATGLPVVRLRRPSGAASEPLPQWSSPGRAVVEIDLDEVGEYLVDVNGSRLSFSTSYSAERALPARKPNWAAELAAAGGGRVVGPGGSSSAMLPVVAERDRNLPLSGFWIALAALLLFIDAVRRALTPGIGARCDAAPPAPAGAQTMGVPSR